MPQQPNIIPRPKQPIKGQQFLWWHRVRNLGRIKFVFLGGILISPLLTTALYAASSLGTGNSLTASLPLAKTIWLITLPLYTLAWWWTWSHMESRYGATVEKHCPACGYSREGLTASFPCPECGHQFETAPTL